MGEGRKEGAGNANPYNRLAFVLVPRALHVWPVQCPSLFGELRASAVKWLM